MAFWTYVLLCPDGLYYTGHTDDLERRIGEHQSGLIKGFTSSRLPVQLIWADYFHTRVEAIENELRVKKWSKAKKRALALQDWDKLSYFSKPTSDRGAVPPGVSSSRDTHRRGGSGKSVSSGCARPKPFVSSEDEIRSEDETPISHRKPISKKPPPRK